MTSETEEAVARVEELMATAAHIESVGAMARISDLRTILSALTASQAEVERLRGALEEAREGLSIAAGWVRSKPDSDRARSKIKRGLDAIRAALNPDKAARQTLEATDDQT